MVLIKKSVLPIMERKARFYVRAQVKLAAEMSIIKEYLINQYDRQHLNYKS